jgi:formylglycine-generating enzyme required for sulfatase activity
MGRHEVTQAQWARLMGTNPSTMKGDLRPVETITRPDAQDFVSKLNALKDGYRYRLPTEAEWEYAARAGTRGPGTESLDQFAWYAGNSEDETHPVGTKRSNVWGLFDMQGNVREWIADLYAANYYGNSPVENPTGPTATPGPNGRSRGGPPRGGADGPRGRPGGGARELPVMRGGAWDNPATFLRLSARYHYYGPTLRVSDVGVRVARELISQ